MGGVCVSSLIKPDEHVIIKYIPLCAIFNLFGASYWFVLCPFLERSEMYLSSTRI